MKVVPSYQLGGILQDKIAVLFEIRRIWICLKIFVQAKNEGKHWGSQVYTFLMTLQFKIAKMERMKIVSLFAKGKRMNLEKKQYHFLWVPCYVLDVSGGLYTC